MEGIDFEFDDKEIYLERLCKLSKCKGRLMEG